MEEPTTLDTEVPRHEKRKELGDGAALSLWDDADASAPRCDRGEEVGPL